MIIMKYLKRFRLILLGFLVMASCQDEDKIYKIPVPISGGAVRATVVPENSLLDGKNLANAAYIFDLDAFDFEGGSLIEKLDIFGTFTDISIDSVFEERLVTTETSFPTRVTLTAADLASVWGLSITDLGGGDLFDFIFVVTMKDGRVFDPHPDIENNPNKLSDGICFAVEARGTCFLQTFINCPSNLEGTYNTSTTGESPDFCCPEFDFPSVITLTRLSPNSYEMSEFSGGVYAEWFCAPFGECQDFFEDIGGNMIDICGSITTSAPYFDSIGFGTVDEATGIITIDWDNEFGDYGTTIFTPQ